jgi:hypothetical protein
VQDLDSSSTTIFVAISYGERQMDKTPTNAQGDTNYLRVEESFELIFGLENSNRAHRRLHGKWQSCGKSHPMTIGRLVQRQTGWHLDRRFRSQIIKR